MGKTYNARLLRKAVFFYREVNQGTASYTFMWQDRINKCLIIINEPYFDQAKIYQLIVILEGTGTIVHKNMSRANTYYYLPSSKPLTDTFGTFGRTCIKK